MFRQTEGALLSSGWRCRCGLVTRAGALLSFGLAWGFVRFRSQLRTLTGGGGSGAEPAGPRVGPSGCRGWSRSPHWRALCGTRRGDAAGCRSAFPCWLYCTPVGFCRVVPGPVAVRLSRGNRVGCRRAVVVPHPVAQGRGCGQRIVHRLLGVLGVALQQALLRWRDRAAVGFIGAGLFGVSDLGVVLPLGVRVYGFVYLAGGSVLP